MLVLYEVLESILKRKIKIMKENTKCLNRHWGGWVSKRVSQNHKIVCVGKDPERTSSPTLKRVAHTGIQPTIIICGIISTTLWPTEII